MSATVASMSKKKPTGGKHKPRRMVGLPERLAAVLEKLADERATTVTEVVKAACVDHLTRIGRWPPAPPGPAS